MKTPRSHLPPEPLSVLLLCSGGTVHIGTVIDNLTAFETRSSHNVTICDALFYAEAGLELDHFDVVVIHYSLVLSDITNIRPKLAEKIRAFVGLKVALIQDEYRWIDRQNAAIESFGIRVLFTATNPEVTRLIYRTPYFDSVHIEHTLTGYVPEELLTVDVPNYCDRSIDVSYRARRCPAWYGSFAEEKFLIGQRFLESVKNTTLACDIEWDESKRIYGDEWIKFVSSSKATLGTESGVSFIDFTGLVQAEAESFEKANPEAASATVRDKFLGDADGAITIKVISPRVFEAAALRTLLVLYPGNYSGALLPYRHYVPLAKDHSNIIDPAMKCRTHAA